MAKIAGAQAGQWLRTATSADLRPAISIYGNNLNFALVRIHCGKYAFWQPDQTAMSPDGQVYFPQPIYHPDFSSNPNIMWLLIHELAHAWQIQSGIWLKFRRLLIEGGVYDYGRLFFNRELGNYTVEQQASIIADWYRLRHRLSPHHGSGEIGIYEMVVRRAIPSERK